MIESIGLLVGAGSWSLVCLLNIRYIERETYLEILELLEELDEDEKIRCFYTIARKIERGLPLKSSLRLIRACVAANLITAKDRPKEREELLLASMLKKRLDELILRKHGVDDRTVANIIALKNILTDVLNESVDYRINLARIAPLIASNLTEQQRTKLEKTKYMLQFTTVDISSLDMVIRERIRLIPEIMSDLIDLQARVVSGLDRHCRFVEAGLLLRKDLFDFRETYIAEVLFNEGLRIVLYDWCRVNSSERFFTSSGMIY